MSCITANSIPLFNWWGKSCASVSKKKDLLWLSLLNISNNILSGEIPTGNQLQTLNDPSIYSNNLGLCGPPLSTPCKHDSSSATVLDQADEHHHELETLWLYYSVIAGTVFGFWNIWRITFFSCIDAMQQNVMQKMVYTWQFDTLFPAVSRSWKNYHDLVSCDSIDKNGKRILTFNLYATDIDVLLFMAVLFLLCHQQTLICCVNRIKIL